LIDKTEYYVEASDYLERAKRRLGEGTHEALLYAAYEVRCAVEARQNRYLNAQKQYALSLPKAWRIGDQGAELERIFASDRIQQITWHLSSGDRVVVQHVPVDKELREKVAKLNDLLHAQVRRRKFYDRWWKQARERVVDVYQRTWICCRGGLLSPVFHERSAKGTIQGTAVMELPAADADLLEASARSDRPEFNMQVEYLAQAPADWKPDVEG
jgi:hypothetical protein